SYYNGYVLMYKKIVSFLLIVLSFNAQMIWTAQQPVQVTYEAAHTVNNNEAIALYAKLSNQNIYQWFLVNKSQLAEILNKKKDITDTHIHIQGEYKYTIEPINTTEGDDFNLEKSSTENGNPGPNQWFLGYPTVAKQSQLSAHESMKIESMKSIKRHQTPESPEHFAYMTLYRKSDSKSIPFK